MAQVEVIEILKVRAEGLTAKELSKLLGVSLRSVNRNVEALISREVLGFKIDTSEGLKFARPKYYIKKKLKEVC